MYFNILIFKSVSNVPSSMNAGDFADFNTTRKRKSDIQLDETVVKKIAQETLKPESTPRKILRRISTKFKLLGSNFIGKTNKCTGCDNVLYEE